MGVVKGKKPRKPTIEADAIAMLRSRVAPTPDLDEEEREGLTLAQAMARVDAGAHPLLEARGGYAAALPGGGSALPRPPDLTTPHTALENPIWRLSVGWLGKEDPRRLFAKRLYLRGNYGGEPRGAGDLPGARGLGLDAAKLVKVAQRIKAVDPELAEWQRRVAEGARRTTEAPTFMGPLRRLLGAGRGVGRQAMDHPMKGGVSDIHNTVVVQVADQYHPGTCSYLYSRHDSIVFEVMLECWDEVTARLRQLALQPWHINGRDVVIPATFKEVR